MVLEQDKSDSIESKQRCQAEESGSCLVGRHPAAAEIYAQDNRGARPSTLLYVEDNPANMELVAQILEMRRPNFQLLRAENGAQGIEMARNHAPQVILMDILLPGISGLEVLMILREDPATRHIPVLAVSANAMPSDIAKGMATGFVRYLTKPFKIEEFLTALDLAMPPKQKADKKNQPEGWLT